MSIFHSNLNKPCCDSTTVNTNTENETIISTAALGPPAKHSSIVDTGSSGHFYGLDAPLNNVQITQAPISVELADHSHITSTHTGELPLPHIPPEAKKAHLFPALRSHPLDNFVMSAAKPTSPREKRQSHTKEM